MSTWYMNSPIECYKHDNCSKYAHSETENQCILMTPHDFNFLAEEPIEMPNNFKFKVNISTFYGSCS